jgi:hypothetical protein
MVRVKDLKEATILAMEAVIVACEVKARRAARVLAIELVSVEAVV